MQDAPSARRGCKLTVGSIREADAGKRGGDGTDGGGKAVDPLLAVVAFVMGWLALPVEAVDSLWVLLDVVHPLHTTPAEPKASAPLEGVVNTVGS